MQKHAHHPEELSMITCSYAPDFNRCERLCRSVDRWVSGDITHWLVVPARDLSRFRKLSNGRRNIVAVEDIVPGSFKQLPRSHRWWLDRRAWPVRGWVMQQVTKLSANAVTSAEFIIFADSDLQFVRPFSRDHVVDHDQLRLHRIAGAKNSGEHLSWHHKAADLLGTRRQYFGHDYIGQLITWRRSHLEGLQKHLEDTHSRPWYQGVARALKVSEYILYGAYIDAVVGIDNSGHFSCDEDLAHCCWFREEADALAGGSYPLSAGAVAVLLQSNLGLSDQDEQRIVRDLTASSLSPVEGLAL
ncbi:DUF6492 family protein [Congregibacter litoralis]|uniref:Glycosyl transferase family 2 n=1 Tax=Congregibacter litoralis KT71 TaxID=314285 RepID=A4AB92_9GAMM|nr:DUF6492 family protein [Congregibacter litoralis]EAQ96646.1 hypothetical protein KT71_06464 [Congregibacter litoralis KT71]